MAVFQRVAKCGEVVRGNHTRLATHEMGCVKCAKLHSRDFNIIAGNVKTCASCNKTKPVNDFDAGEVCLPCQEFKDSTVDRSIAPILRAKYVDSSVSNITNK